jgi:hypothetical protein
MILDRLPDNLEIDITVVVDDAIAHAGDLVERDAGELGARLGCEAGGGFTGHQKTPKDGVLRLGVLGELLRASNRRRTAG